MFAEIHDYYLFCCLIPAMLVGFALFYTWWRN
jgi:hypothetical protein